ncbi:putative transporter SVOPL isoform X5 [Numida meleagris]|uniref:putative transporter SVOPL isoform X5 n=1 Tax=Numida meleagris TaxID=8996 RepID=UPI000B3E1C6A|nr:putative transporter SVOPL isoform X5 [Numida meleagris]
MEGHSHRGTCRCRGTSTAHIGHPPCATYFWGGSGWGGTCLCPARKKSDSLELDSKRTATPTQRGKKTAEGEEADVRRKGLLLCDQGISELPWTPAAAEMAAAPKEAANTIALEEIHTEGPEPPKGQKTFTVEEAVETIGFGRFHIALFLIMGSTGVAEAMEIMLIAVVSPLIRCEWQLQDWQVALVTTMVFFGYMVFSIVLGLLADRLIIKTEFLPTKYRGYMLPLSQVFWLAGSLLIIGLASVVNPTIGWRWLIRIASIPGIILIVVFKFIPESARYNVSTGNNAAALATLQRIAKMNRAAMPEGELQEPPKERRGRFKDLIHPKYLRTTLQIWIIWLGIAFAYYGVILASAELLERDLGCTSRTPPSENPGPVSEESHSPCYCRPFGPSAYRTMIISTAGEIALNPLNILGINFLGRRLSLCITMGCTALFFLLLNICTSSAGMTGFLFMLRALVSANFNTIYIYTAEVYPTTMRALGMGTSGSLCRVGAMVAPFISQVLMSASFLGALCLFSSVCVVCAISAFTLPIETKGRALQNVTSDNERNDATRTMSTMLLTNGKWKEVKYIL